MIICAKAKRNADGTIDAAAAADIQAVREQDVAKITRENDGQVLVRWDDGEPAEYFDAVSVNGEVILSGELRAALAELADADASGNAIEGMGKGAGKDRKSTNH